MRSITRSLLVTATLLTLASSIHAQKAGDNIVGIGVANIAPDLSLGALTSVGPAAAPFNAATAGATARSGAVNTLSLSWLHMHTNNIATEITLGVPPKMTVDVHLTSGDHPGAATARILTPAAVAKYLFNTPADAWRPYLGFGFSYGTFRSVHANTSDPLVNQLGGTSTSLSSSWAPVYIAGIIYNFNEKWSLNGSVAYIPLKTTATLRGTGSGTGTTTSGPLKLDSTDIVVRVGYKF